MSQPPSVQPRTRYTPFASDGYYYEEHVRRYRAMQLEVGRLMGKKLKPVGRVYPDDAFGFSGYDSFYGHTQSAGSSPQSSPGLARPIQDDDLLDYLTNRAKFDESRLSVSAGNSPAGTRSFDAQDDMPHNIREIERNIRMNLLQNPMLQNVYNASSPNPVRTHPRRHSPMNGVDVQVLASNIDSLFADMANYKLQRMSGKPSRRENLVSIADLPQTGLATKLYQPYELVLDVSPELIIRFNDIITLSTDLHTLLAARQAIGMLRRGDGLDETLEIFIAQCADNALSQVVAAIILQIVS